MRTSGFYTQYLCQILLCCTEWGMCLHLLPFLLPQTSHLYQMLGKGKNPPPHALLPTTLLFSPLKPTNQPAKSGTQLPSQ